MRRRDWNMKKFEANLAKEVYHRKNASQVVFEDILAVESGMFEQFLIIGVPPNGNKKSPPQVLFAFPPFEIPSFPVSNIIELCFPSGVERSHLKSNNKTVIQDEFVFQINYSTQKIYGICIHLNPKNSNIPFFASKNTKRCNFCLCMLTKTPVFSAHFTFMTFLSLLTIGKVKSYDGIKEAEQIVIIPTGDPIPDLDLYAQYGCISGMTVPEDIEKELSRYYRQTINSAPITLAPDFQLIWPPNGYLDKAILLSSIDTLFSLLSVRDIINIYSGLILDAQVLVIGSHLQEVTMVIYAFLSLIAPFNFSGTIYPILPANGHTRDLLQLPTPFIFGVTPQHQLRKISFLESCYMVDLDKQRVSTTDYFPKFPQSDKVFGNIMSILSNSSHKSDCENPFSFPPYFSRILNHKNSLMVQEIDAIVMELQVPLSPIISDNLMSFFVTDAAEEITVFNQELFLASIDQNDYKFYEAMMDSQTFQDYVEDKLSTFMKMKGEITNPNRARRESFSKNTRKPRKKSAIRTRKFSFEISEDSVEKSD